jgi:prophage regulatory protein
MTMTADARGMSTEVREADGFYSEPELDRLTTLSRVTRWRMVRAGTFPRPVQLSPGRVGTAKAAVHRWIADRLAQGATEKTVGTDHGA